MPIAAARHAGPGRAGATSAARRVVLALVIALLPALTAVPVPAGAQQAEPAEAYPSRNILLVVPFAPGGPPDVLARIVATPLGGLLGRTIVVENRPGASTTIGTLAVTRAEPDGYTLLASSLSMVVVPQVMAKPGFDPVRDLRSIGLTATGMQTLVVSPVLGVETVQELVAQARQKPGTISAAHTGIGTSTHLGLLAIEQAAGLKFLQVSYRGAAQAISDIVAGHVAVLMTAPSTSIALAAEGKVRLVGITGRERSKVLPQLPTLQESGLDLPILDDAVWFGMSAPARTADRIIGKLNLALAEVLHDGSVTAALARVDLTPRTSTPDGFDELIREQVEVWRGVIAKAGLRPE